MGSATRQQPVESAGSTRTSALPAGRHPTAFASASPPAAAAPATALPGEPPLPAHPAAAVAAAGGPAAADSSSSGSPPSAAAPQRQLAAFGGWGERGVLNRRAVLLLATQAVILHHASNPGTPDDVQAIKTKLAHRAAECGHHCIHLGPRHLPQAWRLVHCKHAGHTEIECENSRHAPWRKQWSIPFPLLGARLDITRQLGGTARHSCRRPPSPRCGRCGSPLAPCCWLSVCTTYDTPAVGLACLHVGCGEGGGVSAAASRTGR